MSGWSIDPVGGYWLVAAAALVLAPLLAIGPPGGWSRRRRVTLTGLRAATLLLLLFVLLRPAWERVQIKQLPGSLLILLDRSRSMQVEDSLNDASRYAAMRDVLAASQEPLNELGKAWDLRAYGFSEEIELLDVEAGAIALEETPDGGQTAIGAALSDVLDREAQQRLAAVLLLSDGAQRAFAPRDQAPQDAARRLADFGVPLYTFAFGKPTLGQQSDLRLSDLLGNDQVFTETPATFEAVVTARGYANGQARVQLLWEQPDGSMQAVDAEQLRFSSQSQQERVKLTHTPTEPGEYKVTMRVEAPEGEAVTANNEQSTFVTVLAGGVNVLYLVGSPRIGGGPGIEPRFVASALASHSDVHVDYDLINYRTPQLDYRDRLRKNRYDAILLGDLDVMGLDRKSWEAMADLVADGTGLAMLGGFHSFGPGGYRGSPLENVLPIELGRAERQNFGEKIRTDVHLPGPLKFVPIERNGKLHPMLRLEEDAGDSNARWAELPELDGANVIDPLRLKPNAQAIAWTGDDQRRPLLVLGAWGAGRTAALAVDTTWHWQMEGDGDVHRRFWRQFVLWLAQKDETAGQKVWVRLDGRRYQQASRVDFAVGANDDAGDPLRDAQFDVQVELPDGTIESVRTTRRDRESIGSFAATSLPGDYRITVAARANDATVDTTTARFTVSDQDVELDQPAAEPTLLANLAELTAAAGGEGLAPEELSTLLERLEERVEEFEERIVEKTTLWDTWPTLLSFVGLLGAEWYLRKRWGLV